MTRAYDRTVRDTTGKGLTIEQIRQYTPAVLATEAWHGVSDRYSPINTTNIIDRLEQYGFMAVAAMQSNSRIPGKYGYTKHQVLFRKRGQVMVGDLFPEVLLINDNAAEAAYRVMAAAFRLVCSNGLTIVDTASDILRIIHTNTTADAVLNATLAIANNMESKLAAIAEMKGIMLNVDERTHLAEQVAIARYGESLVANRDLVQDKDRVRPEALLVPRKNGDNYPDLWHTYNVAQYNAINGGTYVKGNDRARRVTSLDGQLKINLAAWQVAQELRVAHVG